MNFIDTHCHLDLPAYDEDRADVIQRATQAGVNPILIPAIELATLPHLLEIVSAHAELYAAVGIHPNSSAKFTMADIAQLEHFARHPKVVAIGEIGLDYHWRESPQSQQFAALEAQLVLARRLELPVIIHNREASDDVIAILESWASDLSSPLKERPGVLHSFSASPAIAERALVAGFYLGFTGPITYKNADTLRHIAAQVPLERMLLETDGPYLTPVPHRGKRNEPAYIPLIAARLAAIKQVSVETLAQTTTENAMRLFAL